MSDQNSPIDVYYDMEIAQICQHFNKTRNTVDKAIAKLVKAYPDKGWKYKNPETKRITIKAEGVEKLSTYFRKEKHEISTVEQELRVENEKLQAILAEKDKTIANMDVLYNERLRLELEKSRQSFLLEQKNKEEEINEKNLIITERENHIQELETENQKLSEEKKSELEKALELQKQIEEYKRKEEEYNSKSFFYRLTHKFNVN